MRCPGCPVPDGSPCIAETSRHVRYCEWTTEEHPERAARSRRIVELSGGAPPLPPPWRQVANYVVSTAEHVAAGMPEASEGVKAGRLATCRGCDQYRREDARCAACGCPVAAKAARALEACPLGRWPR